MPTMTDPMDALVLYQQAFERGMIPVQPGRQDRDLLVAVDHPNGKTRFSYMRAEGPTLTALVMFAQDGMDEGRPVFALGYAVPEAYRGYGIGKQTVVAALTELKAGLGGARISEIGRSSNRSWQYRLAAHSHGRLDDRTERGHRQRIWSTGTLLYASVYLFRLTWGGIATGQAVV